MILDNLGGPNVITRGLTEGKQECQKQKEKSEGRKAVN